MFGGGRRVKPRSLLKGIVSNAMRTKRAKNKSNFACGNEELVQVSATKILQAPWWAKTCKGF
jgi:hypothetical protein